MRNYIYTGNAMSGRHSTLKHYKYISRKRVGDKWVYEYPDEDKSTNNVPSKAAQKGLDRASARRAQSARVNSPAIVKPNTTRKPAVAEDSYTSAKREANKTAVSNRAQANATKKTAGVDDAWVAGNRKATANKAQANATKKTAGVDDAWVAGNRKAIANKAQANASKKTAAAEDSYTSAKRAANKKTIANRAQANATKKSIQVDAPRKKVDRRGYTGPDGVTRHVEYETKDSDRLFSRRRTRVISGGNAFSSGGWENITHITEVGKLERAAKKGKKWFKKLFGG